MMDNLGLLYLVSGRYQEARSMYQYLMKYYPDRNDTKLHYVSSFISVYVFGLCFGGGGLALGSGGSIGWLVGCFFSRECIDCVGES